MNITDVNGLWRITAHTITNRKTNETRQVDGIPSANAIAYMNYDKFLRHCRLAFDTGQWPKA